MPHRPAASLVLLGLFMLLGACAPHRVRGVVIDGPTPAISVVDAGDPRVQRGGIGGAVLEFTVDPNELSPKRLSAVATDDQGHFDIPVSELGAGFLKYELGVVCRMQGYQAATGTVPLPSSKQRLLVIMSSGRDTYRPKEDIVRETIRLGDPYMK